MRMKPLTKALIGIAAIAALLGLYFASNIKGYYRFKEICEKEGGLKISETLILDKGWSSDKNGGLKPLALEGVAFVRFEDGEGTQSGDWYRVKKQRVTDDRFDKRPINPSNQIKYQYKTTVENMPNELRMQKIEESITDIENGRQVFLYRSFTYEQFERSRTILDAPSAVSCPKYAISGPQNSNRENAPSEPIQAIMRLLK
jgi:hypothetical protein